MVDPPNRASEPLEGSGGMFDGIAARYDLLNRLLSLGIDQNWRHATAGELGDAGVSRVLDLATGTGDLAIQIAMKYPDARIEAVDPSPRMLDVAREKLGSMGITIDKLTKDQEAYLSGWEHGT